MTNTPKNQNEGTSMTTAPIQSETIGKVASALVKAQSKMGVAVKDAVNPHFKSKYADLPSVINAARGPLADNGLAIVQRSKPNERGICLQTMIIHESGEWIADEGLLLPAAKVDPQGFGSAMTYARRFSLAAMLGIVQDDDDGAAAVAAQQAAREKANAPGLSADQKACLTSIMAKAGHTNPPFEGKLAENYATHVETAIKIATKQGALDDMTSGPVLEAALACDLAKLDAALGLGVTA